MRGARPVGLLVSVIAVGCGSGQQEASGNCRLNNSCDPEAWTLTISAIPQMGGRHFLGLRPSRQKLEGRIYPTAVGGTQTIELDARYVVERPERPEFDLVFEDGAEMISRTATSVTFRALRRGRAKMFVEQNGVRSSEAFSYSIDIEEVRRADALPVLLPRRNADWGSFAPEVRSLINIQLSNSNGLALVDESLTVTSTSLEITAEKTSAWDLFTLSPLPIGYYFLQVQSGGLSYDARVVIRRGLGRKYVVLYELDGESLEADLGALPRTTVLCAALMNERREWLSVAEVRFSTDDPDLWIEPLTGEPGTADESVSVPWCRRFTRKGGGASTVIVGIGYRERTRDLVFE